MKKIFLQFLAFSAFAVSAHAQNLTVGAKYSLLTGHGANDNHTSLSGATVFGTYAITDNMAVGTVIHTYGPKKTNYKSGDVAYSATDDVTNVSVSYEFSFGPKEGLMQPFVGIDMGLSTSNHKIEYRDDKNKVKKINLKGSYVMMSPKVGMSVALSPVLGIYTQAQYNFAPGDGGKTMVTLKNAKSTSTFLAEPISKYYNIDMGVYMLLGKIKNIL